MLPSLLKRLLIWFLVGAFVMSINSLVFAGGSFSIRIGQGSDSEDHEVASKVKKAGPPDHAPAHGYRAKHQYRYYPDKSVYYDTARRLYFYMRGDNWEIGASLPAGLKTDIGDYVSLELDTDKPYTYYSEHAKQYPAGKTKNKKSKKWSKQSKK